MEAMRMNERFDTLMVKYGIDRFHPRFQQRLEAERLIRRFAEANQPKKWVLIAENQTDLAFFQEAVKASPVEIVEIRTCEALSQEALEAFHSRRNELLLLVVSFANRDKAMNRLFHHGLRPVSIYDFFALNGLHLTGNFYDVFGEKSFDIDGEKECFDCAFLDLNRIFFSDRIGFEQSGHPEEKEYYLAKMIFDCAVARDMEKMLECISEYVKQEYAGFQRYAEFAAAAAALAQELARRTARRKQRDVIMLWLDQLEYGEDRTMPWLSAQAELGLELERAYTVTPYTHSTARALFYGKYIVDDRIYGVRISAQSPLVSELRQRGYETLFYTHLRYIDDEIKGDLTQSRYAPFSQTYWNFLCDLQEKDGPVFAILHEDNHTHSAFTCMDMSGAEYSYILDPLTGFSERGECKAYTDRVLRYYSGFLSDDAFKIYMSDHGYTKLDRFHTIFRVLQRDIRPDRVQEIFSYISFGKLVKRLIDGDMHYSDIFSDCAMIQDVDFYNERKLKRLFLSDPANIPYYFGYKGVITPNGYYIRYNDGREECYNHQTGAPVTEDWVNESAKLCFGPTEGILQDKKFQYSRSLYTSVENYLSRRRSFEEDKCRALQNIFEEIPEGSVIALRGGGQHTYQLWLALPWRLRKRISFVIDQNPRCKAARLGLPVIPVSQIRQKNISHIIVSAFRKETERIRELEGEQLGCVIIGLYQALKQRGIDCRQVFYLKEIAAEDVDWSPWHTGPGQN